MSYKSTLEPEFIEVAVGDNPLNLSQQQIKKAIQIIQEELKDIPTDISSLGTVSIEIVIKGHQYSLEALFALLENNQLSNGDDNDSTNI